MMDIVANKHFSYIGDVIWCGVDAVKSVKNSSFESVKIIGNYNIMLLILREILSDPEQYEDLKIGCINMVAKWFDKTVTDCFICEINNNYEISIQEAYRDRKLIKHDAKYIICISESCTEEILESIIEEKIPLMIVNLFKK